MARGGARPGAGRPAKPGGRAATQAERAKAQEGGVMPLDYMLTVMRNPKADQKRRDAMATAAAPYVHARLQSTTHKGEGEGGAVKIEIVRFTDPPTS